MLKVPELLSDPAYHDEDAARAFIEGARWPEYVICPLCGSFNKISKLGGESMGPDWWYCGSCQDKFTVRMGAIFERSHIPLHKWLLAFRLMASSKKGVSAHQTHRMLGITYKSAWFLCHRIRECMKETDPSPLGGEGKTIEADETYYGQREDQRVGQANKIPVVTLVERGGKARSVKVENVTAATLRAVVFANADTQSALMTDEARAYRRIGRRFVSHETVNHSIDEYVRKLDDGKKAHTNTIEGFYSIFKRGMKGIYQHCSERHLPRYLTEFDFRYSYRVKLGYDDSARTMLALKGAEGRRLTYRRTNGKAAQADAAGSAAARG